MSHFQFESLVNEATKMDGQIRGQMPRWQRKAIEQGVQPLSRSHSGSFLAVPNNENHGSKTPSAKTPRNTTPGRNGNLKKTPNRGLRVAKTPGKKTPGGTPGRGMSQEDRFIPNRSSTDIDLSHYKVTAAECDMPPSPSKAEFQRKMSENLLDGQPPDAKILSFRNKAPAAQEGYTNNLRVLYSASKSSAPKAATSRHIPQAPDRILDAPDMLDDYYLTLLDWSSNNHLAVALSQSVYIWNAGDGTIEHLFEMNQGDEYVSCVSWISEGNILAVGNSMGTVQLWDVGKQKCIRSMPGHASRVGALSWNAYILSSGSRTGNIHHHDVRVAEHHVGTLAHHSQEVCGLEWAPDGRVLASGGNDNLLCIWDANNTELPMHTLTQHQAAVKALAWCPWQTSLLASGGGTADRTIRFWNVNTGACLNSTDTNSQISSIKWSAEYKELISAHGFAHNQLIIWKYPTMSRVQELRGHTARIICLAMSPDHSTVASAASDETIRLWKCFAVDKPKKKSSGKPSKENGITLMHRGSIR